MATEPIVSAHASFSIDVWFEMVDVSDHLEVRVTAQDAIDPQVSGRERQARATIVRMCSNEALLRARSKGAIVGDLLQDAWHEAVGGVAREIGLL